MGSERKNHGNFVPCGLTSLICAQFRCDDFAIFLMTRAPHLQTCNKLIVRLINQLLDTKPPYPAMLGGTHTMGLVFWALPLNEH